MDNDLLLDAIVWAALGVALACIAVRLAFPRHPGAERSAKEVSEAGD